jgi:hypothetical protein
MAARESRHGYPTIREQPQRSHLALGGVATYANKTKPMAVVAIDTEGQKGTSEGRRENLTQAKQALPHLRHAATKKLVPVIMDHCQRSYVIASR